MNPNEVSDFSQDTYQTGSTRPPKSHGGLIAFLLVLVIFLCGISTALGLMNIRLFRALNERGEETPLAFSGKREAEYTEDIHFSPGFSGREIPELWCLYQDLPRGIYITEVTEATGIQPGDILLIFDGQEVKTADQLSAILEQKKPPAKVVVYRNNKRLETTLSMDNG